MRPEYHEGVVYLMFKNVDISSKVRSAHLKLVQALRTKVINKYAWPEENV